MSDIKLYQTEFGYDIALSSKNDFELDEGLETAIIVSLFCDRRVRADELPPEETSRRGWWADSLNDDKDQTGSKLWLLQREKITSDVLSKAKQYAQEALEWLVTDKVAQSVDVQVERLGLYQIKITVEIARLRDQISQKFAYVWEGVR